uniref:Uncharacterized protein n=1 Tax=Arundo donax TaxID=35708 RepID=A0A0A9E334_ARUDO
MRISNMELWNLGTRKKRKAKIAVNHVDLILIASKLKLLHYYPGCNSTPQFHLSIRLSKRCSLGSTQYNSI